MTRLNVPQAQRAGLIVVCGAILAGVGGLLPWLSLNPAPGLRPTFLPLVELDFSLGHSLNGLAILDLALIGAFVGVAIARGHDSWIISTVTFLTAVGAALILVAEFEGLNAWIDSVKSAAPVTGPATYRPTVGLGLYVTGLGVAIWVIGAAASFRPYVRRFMLTKLGGAHSDDN